MGFEVIWMRGQRHFLSGSWIFSSAQWRKVWMKISGELQLGERRHKYKKRVQRELSRPCYLARWSQRLSIFVIPIKLFYYFTPCSYKPLFILAIDHTYTVRLLTHVLCKPTHFFFHSFIATMSYSLQTRYDTTYIYDRYFIRTHVYVFLFSVKKRVF